MTMTSRYEHVRQPGERTGDWRRRLLPLGAACLACLLAGCTTTPDNQQNSDERLKQQAADATQNVKAGSKIVAANAKVAAAEAARKAKDIADGVKQGLGTPTPNPTAHGDRVDLNSASESELASLPGISDAKARRIIAHRPYADTHQLVKRGLLTEAQYEQVAPEVTAR